MKERNDIELRSESVQDILTKVPHWMIRWGTLVIFGIIAMIFFISWFVKYPDIVRAEVMITTNIPPEKLVAKTSGKIEALLIQNNEEVVKDKPLAVIQNSANYHDVFLLQKELNQCKNCTDFPFDRFRNVQLGEIESAFALFQKDCISQKLNTELHPFEVESAAQHLEASQLQERLQLLFQQMTLSKQELALQKNELGRYTVLHSKGVLSDQEFETRKINYLQSEKNFKNLLSSISQVQSSLIENKRAAKGNEISGTKEGVTLDRNASQSFYQLKKVLRDWELNYVLKASIDGKVSFAQVWVQNQTIIAGDNVFSVVPKTGHGYLGKVKAPALNSGKIKIGQKVNIRLANYPDREFGVLKGIVQNISLVPDKDGNFSLDIALPQNLQTSYKKEIPFQQEMKGSAEIVTEDLRLLQRVLYQFREILKPIELHF